MIYSLESIVKHYRTRDGVVRAVDGLSLEVREGERLALIGRSGAGKTSLFRLLNATLRPTAGTLRFGGRDVSRMSGRDVREMRRRIGTVYQQHYLVPSLSALDNALCGRLGRWSLAHTVRNALRPAKSEAERAMSVLEAVGLADKRHARAEELSGGQQQRLAIARVLMQDPDVILADEPVASLDPALAETIAALLVQLAEDGNRTLITTLHAVDLALRHFPRVVALREGRVAFDAKSDVVTPRILEELFAEKETEEMEEARRDDQQQRRPYYAH